MVQSNVAVSPNLFVTLAGCARYWDFMSAKKEHTHETTKYDGCQKCQWGVQRSLWAEVSLLIQKKGKASTGHLFTQNSNLTSSEFHTGKFSKKHMIEIYNFPEGNSQIPVLWQNPKKSLNCKFHSVNISIRCEFSSVNAKHHNFNSWKPLWMYFVKSVIEYQTENGHGKNGISKIGI